MNIRFATQEEIAAWDELLLRNPDGGNVFQSSRLAETKRGNSWKPRYLMIDQLAVTALEKSVSLLGKFWYLPKGPGVNDISTLLEMLPNIQQFARTNGVFAVKIEPEILETTESKAQLLKAGLVHTKPVQPNSSTVLIDLSPSLDEIMASFNQKGRHALRRAERDGVITQPVELSEDNMRAMYHLLAKTAAGRFESSLRSYDYYKSFWKNFAKNEHGSLFFAFASGELVAAAYCMYLGKNGLYKDGASVRDKTAYGASQLLQWEVMKWMKARGVTRYDLCGAPHSSRIDDTAHPFHGVGRFKTSFNKHVTDYIGCYDLVVDPTKYKLWQKIGQRLALSLSWRLKHRQWF